MSSVPLRKLTSEQYLEIERQSDFKSEFYKGEMFAMSGASRLHNTIQANLIRRLNERLDGSPCQAVGSDLRVHISATGLYTYPDVVVHCEPSRYLDNQFDTLLTPRVLIEILSDSTEKYDRGTKSAQYREIDSLQEYVLVSQAEPRVEVFQRQPDGNWLLRETRTLEDSATLHSVGVTIPMSEIYHRVEFSPIDLAEAGIHSDLTERTN